MPKKSHAVIRKVQFFRPRYQQIDDEWGWDFKDALHDFSKLPPEKKAKWDSENQFVRVDMQPIYDGLEYNFAVKKAKTTDLPLVFEGDDLIKKRVGAKDGYGKYSCGVYFGNGVLGFSQHQFGGRLSDLLFLLGNARTEYWTCFKFDTIVRNDALESFRKSVIASTKIRITRYGLECLKEADQDLHNVFSPYCQGENVDYIEIGVGSRLNANRSLDLGEKTKALIERTWNALKGKNDAIETLRASVKPDEKSKQQILDLLTDKFVFDVTITTQDLKYGPDEEEVFNAIRNTYEQNRNEIETSPTAGI